jgi:Fanconi anemia group M protein
MQNSANSDPVAIVIDDRELRSAAARRLYELGCRLDSRRLPIGDYVVSDRCAVERKNGEDLEDSIIDGRLFSQAVELCETYPAPIIAIVGKSFSRLNPRAVQGALASLAVDFRIPSFVFESEEELAQFLHVLATREQAQNRRPPRLMTERKEVSLRELQQLAVESLPTVGPVHAKALLEKFKSVGAVYSAGVEELQKAEGIGKVRAKRIREVIDSEYSP